MQTLLFFYKAYREIKDYKVYFDKFLEELKMLYEDKIETQDTLIFIKRTNVFIKNEKNCCLILHHDIYGEYKFKSNGSEKFEIEKKEIEILQSKDAISHRYHSTF